MKPNPILKLLFIILLFLTVSIYAQNTLQGVVVDSLTQEPLIGSSVYLIGTSLGAACDIEGEYKIVKIPDGRYKVRISYVGYSTKIEEIYLQGGQVLDLFFQLSPQLLEGKAIVVSAQAIGQAAAINQQITSNTIVNVVSEQKIKELPDVNAAEAIGRLPGVSILRSGGEANKIILRGLSDQYTNVTIDGVKITSTDVSSRGLDLSTISQSSLAGIELYKALTPDKDADAIAGSVNLVTKKAPSLREITTVLKGDYNGLMKSGKQYDFSIKYGERFFDDLLGLQLNGNLENRIRSNERTNLGYDQTPKNQTDYVINDFALEFTDEIRTRQGFGIIFDLATPDGGSIKLNNVFNRTKRDYLWHSRDYPAGRSQNGAYGVFYNFQDREQEIKTFNTSLTGENTLLDIKLNWGLSYAESKSDFPYDYYIDFYEPSISGVASMKPYPTNLKDSPETLVPLAYNNFQAAYLNSANYRTQANFEKERTAFLNFSYQYVFENLFAGELKAGAKYKTKNRSNENTMTYAPYYLGYWQPYEKLADGSVRSKDLSGTYFDAFYKRYLSNPLNNSLSFSEFLDEYPISRSIYEKYSLNPLINRDKLRQWYDLNKNGVDKFGKNPEYSKDPSVNANLYNITESVTSAYLMNTFRFGENIVLIAGVRVESEDNKYRNKYSPIQTGGFPIPPDASRDTTGSHAESIVLPNFHMNFKPTDFMSIRLAAYKALARPDFNSRLNTYFAWRPATTGGNKQLLLGNPLLKTAEAWNVELNTSFYGNVIGLFSVSAFYKEIENMYHWLNGINTAGDTLVKNLGLQWKSLYGPKDTYQLTIPYNSPKPTKVWGFEIEHQINFMFLPGLLRNIVLSYNASLVKSETYLIAAKTDTTYKIVQIIPGVTIKVPEYKDRPIEKKQQLENQPQFYGNISLGYDIEGFSFRISLFHQSEYNLTFSPSGRADQIMNGFTRLDIALKQKFTDYLSAVFNVSNITNVNEDNSIYNRVNEYKIPNTSERYGTTFDFGIKLDL
jgi:TonB-dependent receptor